MAAKHATPITTTPAIDATRPGNGVPKTAPPSRKSAIVCSANTMSVDASSDCAKVVGGSGVERSRFSKPCSLRMTSVIESAFDKTVYRTSLCGNAGGGHKILRTRKTIN